MKKLFKPAAIVFDLDDTLILSDGTVRQTWEETCNTYTSKNPNVDTKELFSKIRDLAIWFWSDPTRHREGRNNMNQTRRDLVLKAFQQLGVDDPRSAIEMADRFSERRYEMLELFPGVINLLKQIRRAGIKTGLLTNGEAEMQRRKIDQFRLEPYFNVIQIEGEKGVGKPEPAAYTSILESLGVSASETWIVGDNLEWEVIIPQTIGLTAIWHNYYQKTLPDQTVRPDLILSEISQLSGVLENTLRN